LNEYILNRGFSSFCDKKERERENGNDSLLLIITVGVQLNYHSLSL
jgi:hypothetical protein